MLPRTTSNFERRFPQSLFSCAVLVVCLWGFVAAKPFLVPLALAGLVAFLLSPAVAWFERQKVPHGLSLLIATLLYLSPFFVVVAIAVQQIRRLINDLPAISQSLGDLLHRSSEYHWFGALHLEEKLSTAHLWERLGNSAGQGVAWLLQSLSAILDVSSHLVLILLFAVLMVAYRAQIRRFLEKALAGSDDEVSSFHAPVLVNEIADLIQRFLLARMIIVAVVSAVAFVIFLFARVPYSFLLGVWVGLATWIPAVGFFVGAAPAVIVALATGHGVVAATLIVACLLVLSLFEGNVLTPRLVGRRLNINALATFVGLWAGALLWGTWGVFLSVPMLAVLRIVLGLSPGWQAWAELLAEREDRGLWVRLRRPRAPGEGDAATQKPLSSPLPQGS